MRVSSSPGVPRVPLLRPMMYGLVLFSHICALFSKYWPTIESASDSFGVIGRRLKSGDRHNRAASRHRLVKSPIFSCVITGLGLFNSHAAKAKSAAHASCCNERPSSGMPQDLSRWKLSTLSKPDFLASVRCRTRQTASILGSVNKRCPNGKAGASSLTDNGTQFGHRIWDGVGHGDHPLAVASEMMFPSSVPSTIAASRSPQRSSARRFSRS